MKGSYVPDTKAHPRSHHEMLFNNCCCLGLSPFFFFYRCSDLVYLFQIAHLSVKAEIHFKFSTGNSFYYQYQFSATCDCATQSPIITTAYIYNSLIDFMCHYSIVIIYVYHFIYSFPRPSLREPFKTGLLQQ